MANRPYDFCTATILKEYESSRGRKLRHLDKQIITINIKKENQEVESLCYKITPAISASVCELWCFRFNPNISMPKLVKKYWCTKKSDRQKRQNKEKTKRENYVVKFSKYETTLLIYKYNLFIQLSLSEHCLIHYWVRLYICVNQRSRRVTCGNSRGTEGIHSFSERICQEDKY